MSCVSGLEAHYHLTMMKGELAQCNRFCLRSERSPIQPSFQFFYFFLFHKPFRVVTRYSNGVRIIDNYMHDHAFSTGMVHPSRKASSV